MAFFNERHCRECGTVTTHNGSDCLACQERKRKASEEAWMALPLDDKLLDLYRRLRELARGPMRF